MYHNSRFNRNIRAPFEDWTEGCGHSLVVEEMTSIIRLWVLPPAMQ